MFLIIIIKMLATVNHIKEVSPTQSLTHVLGNYTSSSWL